MEYTESGIRKLSDFSIGKLIYRFGIGNDIWVNRKDTVNIGKIFVQISVNCCRKYRACYIRTAPGKGYNITI